MLCNRRHGNYQPYFSISSDLYGNKQHINLWWVRFYQLPSMFYHVIWRLRDALSYVSNGNYIWWSKTCRFKKKNLFEGSVLYNTDIFPWGTVQVYTRSLPCRSLQLNIFGNIQQNWYVFRRSRGVGVNS